MDGRRHSVDFPISRTLFALRRVRSLRDPSTNSMSKLSALVDDLNWETKSSSAIILGFDNGCLGEGDDNCVPALKSSSLFMSDEEQCLSEHELKYSSTNCESRLVSYETLGGLVRNTGSDSEREGSRRQCRKNSDGDELQINSGIDHGDSFTQPKRRSKLADKEFRGKTKCNRWNRRHNRLSRVRAGDALSPDISLCLSASDASREGLSNDMALYRSGDVGLIESGDIGCRMRSCWSRTMKSTEPIHRKDVEERPLLLGGAGQVRLMDENVDSQRNSLCLETPRSLSQKFRPKSFKELVGQNAVAKSLSAAISSGMIASLYLFHGPRGTGKTSAARVFAAALNCLSHEVERPCGLCRDCALLLSGRNNDVKELDSVEINKISRFRSLIKNVDVPPIFSRFKVYIIDECHLLRGESWAVLLDKIEELPPYAVFIMVTTDLDKLPSSVVLKTQRCSFQMVKAADIASRLHMICREEGVDIDEDALKFVATKSNGSVRDAETMLDQLSLLSKKITMSLVYEVNGIVADDELLDLLYLALSSDASNTIKKARELIGSRIDPLQLISQLAGLIMDILAGKCDVASESRRKLFGLHQSEARMEQLRHALRILSETEKQLRTSKNQTTWLTVALLQLSSTGVSHEEEAPFFNMKTLQTPEGDCHYMPTEECWKHSVANSCENFVKGEVETLELIWKRAARLCESRNVKNFLKKRGKLVSVRLIQGVAVADLEFDLPGHVSKAEKSWKVIASVLQQILGYNVELRINLASDVSNKYTKLKKASLNVFDCSHRVQLRPNFCVECGSSASEYSSYTPAPFLTRDRHVQPCSLDCGSRILHVCCHGNEMVSSIRNSDGNALSIGIRTPYKSLLGSMDRENVLAVDSLSNGIADGVRDLVYVEHENRARRRKPWKICCWRSVMLPFRKAQALLQKKQAEPTVPFL